MDMFEQSMNDIRELAALAIHGRILKTILKIHSLNAKVICKQIKVDVPELPEQEIDETVNLALPYLLDHNMIDHNFKLSDTAKMLIEAFDTVFEIPTILENIDEVNIMTGNNTIH